MYLISYPTLRDSCLFSLIHSFVLTQHSNLWNNFESWFGHLSYSLCSLSIVFSVLLITMTHVCLQILRKSIKQDEVNDGVTIVSLTGQSHQSTIFGLIIRCTLRASSSPAFTNFVCSGILARALGMPIVSLFYLLTLHIPATQNHPPPPPGAKPSLSKHTLPRAQPNPGKTGC